MEAQTERPNRIAVGLLSLLSCKLPLKTAEVEKDRNVWRERSKQNEDQSSMAMYCRASIISGREESMYGCAQ